MPLPRVRFTVRRLMIAVAIAAFLIGGGIEAARCKRLRKAHLDDAAYHARREAEELRNLANIDLSRRAGAIDVEVRSMRLIERSSRLRVDYHGQMKRKYSKAASRPWRAVSPDPKDPGTELIWEAFTIPELGGPEVKLIEIESSDSPQQIPER